MRSTEGNATKGAEAHGAKGAEARRLAALALPVVGAQLGSMLMGTVDTLMVARVGVDTLAASAMANAWIFAGLLMGQGLVHGIDPIVSQAHGAGDGRGSALALQRGLVLAAGMTVLLAALWTQTENFLLWAGQDAGLARQAHRYTALQIPSIPFWLGFVALRQYLQGREIMRPAMWVVLLANGFNVVANWALIFGHLGAPALGLDGAAIATSLTRVVMVLGLALWIRGFGLHRGAWLPWGREAFDPDALRRVLAIGGAVAAQMSLEIWAFSAATLLAGRIDAYSLAAHTVVLNMCALAFMVPLGIAQAAATRVGNLIGAGEAGRAQLASHVALFMGAAVMAVSAASFVGLRQWLPRLYTTEEAVVALGASILPIAAAFQIFDGTQVVGCGILRGMGRTRPAAWFNLLGYWVLGLPLGAWLALRGGWGLTGIWWGLCVGLFTVALLLVFWVRTRGPAHAVALGEEGPASPACGRPGDG